MGRQDRLALIEVVERDGRVRQQLDVPHWPLTIGRALDRDVVIDDPHVAAAHAVLVLDEAGRLWLDVGDTRNGVRVGRHTAGAGERLALQPGDAMHFGHTRLRVRLPADPVPAEKPMAAIAGPATLAWTAMLSLVLWGLLLAEHWVESDPKSDITQWMPLLLGVPGVLALWCMAWALASKLFQHRFEFGAHWQHAVRWMLGLTLGALGLSFSAAALGAPWLFALVGLFEAAVLTVGLYGHARLVLPTQARVLAGAFGMAFVVGIGAMMVMSQQREQRLMGPLYMHLLPPHPTLRLARPQTPQAFVERARGLHDKLDHRAQDEPDEDDEALVPEAGGS